MEGLGPFRVVEGPIDGDALRRAVERQGAGAVVLFHGTVRDRTGDRRVLWLEYEAFPSMAVRQLEAIGAEVAARHGLSALACAHRTGRLEIGEAAVVVAASAPHRRAALEGIEAFLRRLKQDVPIWKKEFFEGGAAWIGSPEDPQALRAAEETAP